MQWMKEYAAGLAAAAIICAITLSFSDSGTMTPLLKLICGLVLTFAAVRPVLAFPVGDFETLRFDSRQQAEAAAEAGQQMAGEALREIIIRRTKAYIEDKASRLGLQIQVQVKLSPEDPPVPQHVTITGPVSPYDRKQLTWFLEEHLGIGEENLQWN